jgi:hypothetical protein
MEFKYMDISPYATEKVLYCSDRLFRHIKAAAGFFMPGPITVSFQEGTKMVCMPSHLLPVYLEEKQQTIHGLCLAKALGDVDPLDFIPKLHAPDRELWTFKF